jgi:hypothetical protein
MANEPKKQVVTTATAHMPVTGRIWNSEGSQEADECGFIKVDIVRQVEFLSSPSLAQFSEVEMLCALTSLWILSSSKIADSWAGEEGDS